MLASSVALGLIGGLALGRDWRRIAQLPIRALPLILAAAALRVVALAIALPWQVYALALGAFVVAAIANRHLPGAVLIAAGISSNLVVICLNGGMPVSAEAASVAGATIRPDGLHVVLTASTVLPWLADIIPMAVFQNVYSVGDVVLAAGGFWLPFAWLRR